MSTEAGLQTLELPEGLRLRRAGALRFAFNYAAEPRTLFPDAKRRFLVGSAALEPAGLAVWREDGHEGP